MIAQNYNSPPRLQSAFLPSFAGAKGNWFTAAIFGLQATMAVTPYAAASLPMRAPQTMPVPMVPKASVLTAREMTDFLVTKLAFPITALSDVLDVERKTIYDWVKGSEAGPAKANHLQRLVEIFALEEAGSLRVFHRFWKRTLPDGSSLHGVLTAPTLEPERIRSALNELRPAVRTAMTSDHERSLVSYEAPHPAELLSDYLEVGSR